MTVIDLDAHREVPGTVWWAGVVRCTSCDHVHVAVAPMPDWASCPHTGECPACHEMSCLPVASQETP